MTTKIYPPVRHRTPRHAHRPSRRDRRGIALLTALGVAVLVMVSLGSVLAAPGVGTGQRHGTTADGLGSPNASTGALTAAADAQLTSSAFADARLHAACAPPASPAAPAIGDATTPRSPATAVATAARHARGPVVFLGDSYTSGYVGAGYGTNGWPAIVSRAEGWRMTNLAVPGTGFVNPGWTNQPIRTELAAVIRLDPGVVVIAGGHNDRRFGAPRTDVAADSLIDRLRVALPRATLLIIGPIWQDGSPAASIVGIRNHLRAKARSVGALFIDPIAGGWFSGTNHRFIGPDGTHPTNAGHRHMAALVLAALRADRRFRTGRTSVAATVRTPAMAAAQPARDGSDRRPAMVGCPS